MSEEVASEPPRRRELRANPLTDAERQFLLDVDAAWRVSLDGDSPNLDTSRVIPEGPTRWTPIQPVGRPQYWQKWSLERHPVHGLLWRQQLGTPTPSQREAQRNQRVDANLVADLPRHRRHTDVILRRSVGSDYREVVPCPRGRSRSR